MSTIGPKGFTLTELLAVVAVGGLLIAGLTSFYLSEQRSFRQQQIQVETSQGLRVALDQMVRDLRAAGLDPEGTANAGITYADAVEMRFTLDSSGNGALDSTFEESKGFRLNGSTLETWVPAGGLTAWRPLVEGVRNTALMFRYFRDDGTEITALPASSADRTKIRRIDITLTVGASVPGAPPIERTEIATARLRNRP